ARWDELWRSATPEVKLALPSALEIKGAKAALHIVLKDGVLLVGQLEQVLRCPGMQQQALHRRDQSSELLLRPCTLSKDLNSESTTMTASTGAMLSVKPCHWVCALPAWNKRVMPGDGLERLSEITAMVERSTMNCGAWVQMGVPTGRGPAQALNGMVPIAMIPMWTIVPPGSIPGGPMGGPMALTNGPMCYGKGGSPGFNNNSDVASEQRRRQEWWAGQRQAHHGPSSSHEPRRNKNEAQLVINYNRAHEVLEQDEVSKEEAEVAEECQPSPGGAALCLDALVLRGKQAAAEAEAEDEREISTEGDAQAEASSTSSASWAKEEERASSLTEEGDESCLDVEAKVVPKRAWTSKRWADEEEDSVEADEDEDLQEEPKGEEAEDEPNPSEAEDLQEVRPEVEEEPRPCCDRDQ
ncbi:unnamed protein product, partial [Polarella glacialis]